MAATRAEILESFVEQLNRFDQEAASVLRSNRWHIAVTADHVAGSFAQMGDIGPRGTRWLRDNRSFLPRSLTRR